MSKYLVSVFQTFDKKVTEKDKKKIANDVIYEISRDMLNEG